MTGFEQDPEVVRYQSDRELFDFADRSGLFVGIPASYGGESFLGASSRETQERWGNTFIGAAAGASGGIEASLGFGPSIEIIGAKTLRTLLAIGIVGAVIYYVAVKP